MRGLDGAIQALDALAAQLARHGPPDTLARVHGEVIEARKELLRLQLDALARGALDISAGVKSLVTQTREMHEMVFGGVRG